MRTLRVIGFALLRLTAYDLHHGTNPQTITFTYKGSVPCTANTGATLTLTPGVAGPNVTTTSQTMQVTLKDRPGNPMSGASVTFTVTGDNATSGSATTNSSGQAGFTYTGANAGFDSIQATTTVSGATVTSNSASVAWIAPNQPIATTTVWGRFYPTSYAISFHITPDQTPTFTQAFPSLNLNPPAGTFPGQPATITEQRKGRSPSNGGEGNRALRTIRLPPCPV